MNKRIPLYKETAEERAARWMRQPSFPRALDTVLSHLVKFFGLYHSPQKWILYKLVFDFFRVFLWVFNRKKTFGRENVPKQGSLHLY